MYPAGAGKVAASAGKVGHAQSASAIVERKSFRHPAGRSSLHDRPIHHEHRAFEKLPEDGLRARNPLLDLRRVRGFVPEEQLTAEIAERAEKNRGRSSPVCSVPPW